MYNLFLKLCSAGNTGWEHLGVFVLQCLVGNEVQS